MTEELIIEIRERLIQEIESKTKQLSIIGSTLITNIVNKPYEEINIHRFRNVVEVARISMVAISTDIKEQLELLKTVEEDVEQGFY